MATVIDNGKYLLANSRIFLPSRSINVFPCSRRGQSNVENVVEYYDPEARLNTERTNRIGTAINGFKDSFIVSFDDKDASGQSTGVGRLKFVLAGYHFEIPSFNPADIAAQLGAGATTIYAHLGIQTGVSLLVADYATEVLYRQSTETSDSGFLDVKHGTTDFFVGVSFTANEAEDNSAAPYNIPLFSVKTEGESTHWLIEQASLLPKIDHDTTKNSVVLDELHTRENLWVDKNLVVAKDVVFGTRDAEGKPTMDEDGNTVNGNLIANSVTVPYVGSIQGFPETEITNSGIATAYIRAGSLKANGLAVGNEITIVDDKDRDNDKNADEALTTIGKGYVSAADKLVVPGIFEAIDNNYTVDDSGKITATESIKKVTISADNGLIVNNQTVLKGPTTINDTLTVDVGADTKTPNKKVTISANNGLEVDLAAKFNSNITVGAGGALDDKAITVTNLKVDTIKSRTTDTEVRVKSPTYFEKDLKVVDADSQSLFEITNADTTAATFNVPTTVNNSVAVKDAEGQDLFSITDSAANIKVAETTIDTDNFTVKQSDTNVLQVINKAVTGTVPTIIKNDLTISKPDGDQVVKIHTHVTGSETPTVTINYPTDVNNTITAQNLEIDSTDGEVNTPTLVVNTITTNDTREAPISIDKAVNITDETVANGSALTVAGLTTLNKGLNVTGETAVTGITTVQGNFIVKNGTDEDANDIIVEQSSVTINGSVIVNSLLGEDNSIIGGEITTPTLKVETITSNNKIVVIDETLKVNNIDTAATSLTIKPETVLQGHTTVQKDLLVTTSADDVAAGKTSDITVDEGNITVEKGTITTNNLTVNGVVTLEENASMNTPNVTVSSALNVTKLTGATSPAVATIDKADITELEADIASVGYINVGSPVQQTQTAGDIVAKHDIKAENNITAKNTIIAPKFTQNGKPVPAIAVEEVEGKWQLQITLDASKK